MNKSCGAKPETEHSQNITHVLHVDDDASMLEVSKSILELEHTFVVETATSVDEALKKLEQQTYDAVVSDYEMPQKDGLQFLKELKEAKKDTPFILFTGKGREDVAIAALNSGAAYYLNKQGKPETVYGELSHAIVNAAKTSKAEKALRESEAKYRELINGMSESVWVIDFEGNFIDANDAAVKVLGYSRAELLSLGIRGIDKHLSQEQVQNLISQLPKVGTQVFETVHTAKDGQEVPVEISSSLVTYQGKQAILSIARNIAERKKAEHALIQSEERFSKIFYNNQLAMALSETDGKIVDTNKNFENLFAVSRQEIIGHYISEFVQYGDINKREKTLRLLNKGTVSEDEQSYVLRTGKEIETVYYTQVLTVNGKKRFLGMWQDFTERKKAEEETHRLLNMVQQEKEKLSSLVSSISDEIWFADTEKKFTLANPAALKEFGLESVKQIDIEKFAQSIEVFRADGSKRPVEEAPPLRALRGEIVKNQEELVRVPSSGALRYRQVSSSPVKDAAGNILGAVSVVRDITERKKTEQMLRENEERLRLKLDSVLSPDVDIDEQELSNVIDVPQLQTMMDDLYEVTKMVFAILDLKGNVLVKTGWEDICTKFHRVNPQTCKNCIESDLELSIGVKQGEFRLYKCKNNMWDIVTPIILNEKHIGNIYSGQFFFEDEQINRETFAAQAEKYGFNKEEYLSAFDRVPRLSREKIQKFMLFNTKLSEMISKLSFSNLKIAKALSDQKAIEGAIHASEQRWAATLSSIGDAVIATDKECKITFMNHVAEKLTGWSLFEAAQKPLKKVFCIINEETRAPVENPVERALKEGLVVGLANHTILLCKDGKEVPIADSVAPIRDEDNNIMGVVLVFRDITERKKAEEKLRKLNRALRTISESNQALIRATDVTVLAQEVCQIAVKDCGYDMAWVGLVEHDKNKTVRPVAYEGFDKEYVDSMNMTWADTERGRGPIGTAIRTGKPQICANILTDTKFEPWREQATKRGYASSLALPLISEGNVLGVLNIYSKEPDAFSEEEVALLTELASDLGYGFMMLKVRADKEKAEQSLIAAKDEWERTFDAVPDLIAILDDKYRIVQVNRAMAQKLGLTPEQCIGLTCYKHVHGTDAPPDFCPHTQTLRDGKEHAAELSLPVLGGDFLVTTSPLKDENGRLTGVVHVARDITPLKQSEVALRQSQEQFFKLFHSSPSAMCVALPPDWRYSEVNESFLRLTEYSREELIGHTSSELNLLCDPVERAKILDIMRKQGSVSNFEVHAQTKSGKRLRLIISTVMTTFGGRDCAITTLTDISKLRQNEEALRVSETQYRGLFEQSYDGMLLTKPDGSILAANVAACQMLGMTKEEIIKVGRDGIVVRDEKLRVALEERKKKGSVRAELTFRRKDGTTFVGETSSHIFLDAEGVAKTSMVIRDISERKSKEAVMRESEQRFREFAESLPEIVFETDSEGKLTFLNTAAFENTGFSVKEALGLSCLMFLAPEDRARARENFQKIMQGKESTGNEYLLLKKDGTPIPVMVYSRPINANGKTGLRGVIVDISFLKIQPKVLAVINDKLRVIGSMTRHDVNNKLAIIQSNAYLLRQQIKDKPELVKYIDAIEKAISASSRLFEFSRLYEKIGSEKLGKVNVGDSFDKARDIVTDLRTMKVVNKCADLSVVADSLLEKVLFNLIDNSLRHGKKVTCIKLRHTTEPGHIKLFYEDNGFGISDKDRSKLFKEGFSTSNSTGLGLHLIKKIIEFYGWTITEEGTEGKGAKFVISIPQRSVQ